MTKTIDINLFDDKSIAEAIYEINKFKDELLKVLEQFLEYMLSEGEDFAINELGHVDTGETLASLFSYRNGNKGVIVVGGNAVWLEFGTGVTKNGSVGTSPHPLGEQFGFTIGTYGKGNGSKSGWWYFDNGEMHYTQGIKANSFMYRTAQYLEQNCEDWAKHFFEGNND